MHLSNWKARRAGGRITINGENVDDRKPAKIVGVDVIEPFAGAVRAIDKNGDVHTLALA
jgi:ribosome-associated protein YbcJ (S4-like RNA binding protein)